MNYELGRIKELDFLKGVLILLVISFHLVWFEQLHPDIKQVVYCFHMPGFLLISGYLMNISKSPRDFLKTLLWLAVPYVVMESGYIYMASILPINEHIAQLTPWVYLKHLFLHPLGPYWYLHAIILCGATYYYIYNNVERGMATRFILIGIAYYVFAHGFGILTFSSALYFLAGAMLRQSGMNFVAFFFRHSLCPAGLLLGWAHASQPERRLDCLFRHLLPAVHLQILAPCPSPLAPLLRSQQPSPVRLLAHLYRPLQATRPLPQV